MSVRTLIYTGLLIILIAVSAAQESSGDDQSTEVFPKGYDMLPSCGGYWGGPENGYVSSTNYPENYENNMDCVYVIEANFGYVISLIFASNYMIESSDDCEFDNLEIRDGRWGFSPLIGTYCGNNLPIVVTRGRYLWMRFCTDDTVTERGFSALYDFISVNTSDNEIMRRQTKHDCMIEVGGMEGIINSADVHPGTKSNDLDCIWKIEAPAYHKILLRFDKFVLEMMNLCAENQVTLYDKLSSESSVLGTYCSDSVPEVFSLSNRVYLRYVTGSNSIDSSFQVTFTAFTDHPCFNGTYFACGEEMCIDKSLVCNDIPNCYHYAWDEKGCPTENHTPPLMETYAGVLFGAMAGITLLIIGVIIIMSARHSWRQTKRRASLIEYRRRSLAALSSARSSDAAGGGGLAPGEFHRSSIRRHGSLPGDYTGPNEYHELETVSSKYNYQSPRRTSVSSGRSSSPTRKMANCHGPQCQPMTLQVPTNSGLCSYDNKTDSQYSDDRILSTSFTYGEGFESFSTEFSRPPQGSFEQEFSSMPPPSCYESRGQPTRTVTQI